MYSFMVFTTLLLQKPMEKCSYKEGSQYLRRRLELWEKKDLDELMDEGQCMQRQYRTKTRGG